MASSEGTTKVRDGRWMPPVYSLQKLPITKALYGTNFTKELKYAKDCADRNKASNKTMAAKLLGRISLIASCGELCTRRIGNLDETEFAAHCKCLSGYGSEIPSTVKVAMVKKKTALWYGKHGRDSTDTDSERVKKLMRWLLP